MKDTIVMHNLQRAGVDVTDLQQMLPYMRMEARSRVLDKPPAQLDGYKYDESYNYGCCGEIIMGFNKVKQDYPDTAPKFGVIELNGTSRQCDLSVYFFLKSLVLNSLNVIKERGDASFAMFKTIVMAPGDLTNMDYIRSLLPWDSSDYYTKEIVKAAKICIFGENVCVQYWENCVKFTGFYGNALVLGREVIAKECQTIKDVNTFVRNHARDAAEDKEFMKKIYKPGANRYLYAMIYYLKDLHPEVMESGKNDGFAE